MATAAGDRWAPDTGPSSGLSIGRSSGTITRVLVGDREESETVLLNLQRLVVLHELERRGTLAAVAAALSYSPSTVSQQLSQLERDVGVALTEPVGRGLRLTDAGRVLVEHTRVAIAELEAAESALARAHGRVAGRLRVASFQTVVLSLLPAVIGALAADFPDLRVEVTQREIEPATSGLAAGEFDLVFGEEYPGHEQAPTGRFHRVDLGSDPMFLALPRRGRWSDAGALRDVADAPWALDPPTSAPGRWARDLCRGAGFEPDVRFDGIDLLTHVHLVQSGSAVAMLPALLGAARTREVTLLPLPGGPERRLFTLTRPARADHPAVRAFREALRAAFDESQP